MLRCIFLAHFSISTNVQRIISGTMKLTGLGGEAKYSIHYTTLPVNYDTTMIVLDTDYKNYAVIWSCNGIGPVGHTGRNNEMET